MTIILNNKMKKMINRINYKINLFKINQAKRQENKKLNFKWINLNYNKQLKIFYKEVK